MAARPVSAATPGPPAPRVPGSAHGAEQVSDRAVPAPAGTAQGLPGTPWGERGRGRQQAEARSHRALHAAVPVGQAGGALGSHNTPAMSRGWSGTFPAAVQACVLHTGGSKALCPRLQERPPKAADALTGAVATAARFPSPQVLRSLNKTYKNMKRKPVIVDLDPKAVTCDELFGVIHPSTREWKDGETPTLVHMATRAVAYPSWDLAQTIFRQLLVHRQIPS